MRTAGIELRGKERRSRGIDYKAEVAFEKKPAPGFYDTGAETAMTKDMQQEFRPTTVEEMEGKRRKVCVWCGCIWRGPDKQQVAPERLTTKQMTTPPTNTNIAPNLLKLDTQTTHTKTRHAHPAASLHISLSPIPLFSIPPHSRTLRRPW